MASQIQTPYDRIKNLMHFPAECSVLTCLGQVSPRHAQQRWQEVGQLTLTAVCMERQNQIPSVDTQSKRNTTPFPPVFPHQSLVPLVARH